ncbi:MAG: hypothetical protein MUO76_05105, partial [Anaerolineaceae bacterium]|nr:hypothetical protein [Anaerolineaceae bacterium]
NTIQGALHAQRVDHEMVIVGEEILTEQGEILAFFVKEVIPAGLSHIKTVELLREQDAFISVSHPFDIFRHPWDLDALLDIIPYIDAIEVFNARSPSLSMSKKALEFASLHKLAGTVGSDAHILYEVGFASLRLPAFSNAAELRDAIGFASPQMRQAPFWVRFGSIFAKLAKYFQKEGDR